MAVNFITAKTKTKVLMHYVKDYKIRDTVTLGIVFRLWSDLEAIAKGVFLDDLAYITNEPLLVIGIDESKLPTRFTYKGREYGNVNDVLNAIQTCDRFYIHLTFPEDSAPYWYINICTPNPFAKALPGIERLISEIREQVAFDEEFLKIYREALMILINGSLDAGDKNQFMMLSKEWKKIA